MPVLVGGTPLVQFFSETFADSEVYLQIFALGKAVYVWMGDDEAQQGNLALGVPPLPLPTGGSALIGNKCTASTTMAQRLSKKLGHPVFVSINLKDNPALHTFAERRVVMALQKLFAGGRDNDLAAANHACLHPYSQKSNAGLATKVKATSLLRVGMDAEEIGAGTRTYTIFDAGDSALGQAASAMLLEAADDAIRARGQFSIALSCGSIAKLLAPSLLAAVAVGRGTAVPDFASWHVFLADERYVPLDHVDSNLGVWNTQLLHRIGIPKDQIHALDVTLPLAESAAAYEAGLCSIVGGGDASMGGDPPVIDALVLGMGADGHTASLFDGYGIVHAKGAWVQPIFNSPNPPAERITLTLPCMNAARLCLFVVTGVSKALAVKDAFSPEPVVSSGRVLATQRTHWLLDASAAGELRAVEEEHSNMYS